MARLAELLAPARIVSHLAHVTAVSATSVRAGVLVRAEATAEVTGDEEADGRVVFRHVVTDLGAHRSG
ncbi:hypothetical protein [Streptomyces djakartensis]|uniref:hypothetical protein n=1 Tax=Streptomyces djakartensis TaxID=68193 RepID=UPI0034DF9869